MEDPHAHTATDNSTTQRTHAVKPIITNLSGIFSASGLVALSSSVAGYLQVPEPAQVTITVREIKDPENCPMEARRRTWVLGGKAGGAGEVAGGALVGSEVAVGGV